MIRPTLVRYQVDQPPQPVNLDSGSVLPDAILLLDSFFHVVVSHGELIAAWRKEGYFEMAEYVSFKRLLEAAEQDALELISDRFPIPHYVLTDQNESQARFLISKLNPSTTHVSPVTPTGAYDPNTGVMLGAGPSGQAVFTDDVSLQVFMEHLKRLAVSASTST